MIAKNNGKVYVLSFRGAIKLSKPQRVTFDKLAEIKKNVTLHRQYGRAKASELPRQKRGTFSEATAQLPGHLPGQNQ